MKSNINRRNFISKSAQVCAGCCVYLSMPKLLANKVILANQDDDEIIDPKTLNYCSYKCPANCQFLKGSLENDVELKKEAYKLWKIKERFGVDFDPDKIFCFGCKTKDKPEGIVLKNCTVRSCAIEKNHDCCIECEHLNTCQKELWDRFPDFKKSVIEMQEKYFETQKKA